MLSIPAWRLNSEEQYLALKLLDINSSDVNMIVFAVVSTAPC